MCSLSALENIDQLFVLSYENLCSIYVPKLFHNCFLTKKPLRAQIIKIIINWVCGIAVWQGSLYGRDVVCLTNEDLVIISTRLVQGRGSVPAGWWGVRGFRHWSSVSRAGQSQHRPSCGAEEPWADGLCVQPLCGCAGVFGCTGTAALCTLFVLRVQQPGTDTKLLSHQNSQRNSAIAPPAQDRTNFFRVTTVQWFSEVITGYKCLFPLLFILYFSSFHQMTKLQ